MIIYWTPVLLIQLMLGIKQICPLLPSRPLHLSPYHPGLIDTLEAQSLTISVSVYHWTKSETERRIFQ